MEKPRYFLIDSRDRISGTSSDFNMQLRPGIEKIKSVKLLGVVLPLTNYVVNSNNNLIYFSDGTNYVASMIPGIYDYITIRDEIKRAMEATAYAGTITVTYSDITLKFTITGSTAISLQFGSFTENSANYILGFNESNKASALSHTSDDIAHLSVPPVIYLEISAFPSLCTSSNRDNATFILFSQFNSGYVTFHWCNTHYELETQGSTAPLQNFNVKVKYRGNNILDLNDTDFQLLLQFDY